MKRHSSSSGSGAPRPQRRRRNENTSHSTGLELCDSLVSVRLLLQKQQQRCPDSPPIVLQSQLYSLLPERSQVDAELRALQEGNASRTLFLPTEGPEATGVILFEDYERLSQAALRAEEDGVSLQRLFRRILRSFKASSLPKDRLVAFLEDAMLREERAESGKTWADDEDGDSGDPQDSADDEDEDVGDRDDVEGKLEAFSRRVEEILATLSRHQLLVPLAENPSHRVLYFSLPCVRRFCDQLEKGQKSLLRALRMRRFRELSMKEIASRALQRCALQPEVVVDRLEERGFVIKLETASGTVIRLTSRDSKRRKR